LKFESPYSRVNIHCSRDPHSVHIKSLKHQPYLEVIIELDLPPLDTLSSEQLQQQFMQIISIGLESAGTVTPIPLDHCQHTLAEFKNGGYFNKWVHVDKYWKRKRCRCIVSAELTMDHFVLDQSVYMDDKLVATRRVAETKSREMLFYDYLGDLSINSNGIMIYRKKGTVLSEFNLNDRKFKDD
jgi:hypothetical protein